MIQLSNIILMFAASTDQADTTYSISKRLFLCLDSSLYPKDIRLSIPYMAILTYCMSCLLGRRWEETAFLVSTHFKFIHSMTKQDEICNAGNNSTRTATSAHETCAVSLTGNPYQDLASYGFDLHRCTIRYHQSPNNNGNTITGDFNISGRIHTAGATSYACLIGAVVQLRKAYQQYVSECHKRKRDRNRESWLHRHPEYTNRITNIYINITGNNNTAQLGVRNLMTGK